MPSRYILVLFCLATTSCASGSNTTVENATGGNPGESPVEDSAVTDKLDGTVAQTGDGGRQEAPDGTVPSGGDLDGGARLDATCGDTPCLQAMCRPSCTSHGTCDDAVCKCSIGYSGEACQECAVGFVWDSARAFCITDLCTPNPCMLGLQCIPSTGACCESPCTVGESECTDSIQRTCTASANVMCGEWAAPVSCGMLNCGSVFQCGDAETTGLTWQRGSSAQDWGLGVAVGPGEQALVVGRTHGDFDGPNIDSGGQNMFVMAQGLQPTDRWTRQWVGGEHSVFRSIARTPNNEYVLVGNAMGPINDIDSADRRALVARMNEDGQMLWVERWGPGPQTEAHSVAVGSDGFLYVAGWTTGDYVGVNAGSKDCIITKLKPDGSVVWAAQWGTIGRDEALAVAVDSQGNVYTAGYVTADWPGVGEAQGEQDAFVVKHSQDGVMEWSHRWGTSGLDIAFAIVAAPDDSIFVAGGASAPSTAFVSKWSPDGTQLWMETFGGGSSVVYGIALDAQANLYSATSTSGLNDGITGFGSGDVFLSRWQDNGTAGARVWSEYYGTPERESVRGIAVAPNGDLLVTGFTTGSFPGAKLAGVSDVFLLRVTPGE